MKKNNIITASSIVLFLLGISQLLRIFYDWNIIISEREIPKWVSLIATIIPLFLSYNLLKTKKK